MKILVTGAAGFIGSRLMMLLAERGDSVVGIDNINDYYDVRLKYGRLRSAGFETGADGVKWGEELRSSLYGDCRFVRLSIDDKHGLDTLFAKEGFDKVVNLAAQAGVRYSITNPYAYLQSNLVGFLNILEACRNFKVGYLVYASSSSVYGTNEKVPYSEDDKVDSPVSLYAATKKSNELMAHAYSKLYGIKVTGLRYFTVYGPWGRPDMSPMLFATAIEKGEPIKVFNNGDMIRDFTYIDDIVEGIVRVIGAAPRGDDNWNDLDPDPATSTAPYRIYNIGNQRPTKLMDYISCIEKAIGREAVKEFLPMQSGDVYRTYADSSALAEATGFKPDTALQEGIDKTVAWFENYYGIAR